jgi:hypothetical protein
MPSLKSLLLAGLATLTTTTLAAPTTIPNPTILTTVSKRAEYHPSPQTENDYCGEAATVHVTHGDNTPFAKDCRALYEAHKGPGYWTVSAAETRALDDAAGADRWTRLAAQGSCAFEVRLSRENDSPGKAGLVDYRFGTNDMAFYIKAHASESVAKAGRIGVRSGVWCRREKGQAQVRLDWRIVIA